MSGWVICARHNGDMQAWIDRLHGYTLIAGLVLGYSSRLAFGCNVGAMFSGISTGSIHGWIWVPLAFAGTILGLRIRRHFGF